VSAVVGTPSVVDKPVVEGYEKQPSTTDRASTWDVVRFGHALGFEGRPSRSLLVTLKLRLDVESGRLRPYAVGAEPLPDDVHPNVRTSYEGFVHLLGCRWHHTPFEPAPWTAEFAACWCGISTRQAKDARRELVQMRALLQVGESRRAKLWLPWASMPERLLTARELPGYLGLKPGTVLDKWERGEFPGYKFGRAVRFDLEEVLATGRPGGGGVTPITPSTHPAKSVFSRMPITPIRGGEDA
jgi:excisionase family DNA binding protein